jgi:MFS family permease
VVSTETGSKDQMPNLRTTRSNAVTSKLPVLALVNLTQFMVVLDFTIVQVALPSIGREFAVSINGLQWIVTAYGLALAGFLLLSGRAGDIYGHKKLFIV